MAKDMAGKSEIANPDKIYPGQKIRIPLRYAQKEEQGKQKTGAAPGPAESPLRGKW